MEQLLHLAQTLYIQHTTEIILGLLACMIVLMIINLAAVRRCRRQVRNLNEKTKEFVRVAMRQNGGESRQKRDRKEYGEDAYTERRGRTVSKEDDEIFGSVIQEIFS